MVYINFKNFKIDSVNTFLIKNIYTMKTILNGILRKRIVNKINDIGQGISEIIIDLELSIGQAGTIEYIKDEDRIIIHCFKNEFDFSFDFEDLYEQDKIIILSYLKAI